MPRSRLSSQAGAQARMGALLKIEHPGIGVGYADLHAWPELGDLPLSDQLSLLRQGSTTSLTRNALEFSRIDARARSSGQSLWKGLTTPRSHALITDIFLLTRKPGLLESLLEAGFERIKIKAGRDPLAEAEALNQLAPALAGKARVRLDFNASLTARQLTEFLSRLSSLARDHLDFIEDPTLWSEAHGFGVSAEGMRIALDRDAEKASHESLCPDLLVIKPAVTDWATLLSRAARWNRPVVITSYLDHPLGQLSAAYVAANALRAGTPRIEICGLLSQDAYEPHAFSDLLPVHGPELTPPAGAGFGWDQELAALSWKELK